ncbi:putative pectinesterase 29 [Acorus gramineus]|uniref:Pectinesterase n=1 Tax=Acorus gramineus TaxID=55184 RepID=A0AAV9BKY6_ACOGR|nr:putative pectinesterase 29 [Acorus gramineus]
MRIRWSCDSNVRFGNNEDFCDFVVAGWQLIPPHDLRPPSSLLSIFLSVVSHCVSVGATASIAVTYIVDLNGSGQYKTIQEAINAVPDNNDKWYRILVKRGLYRIPVDDNRVERLRYERPFRAGWKPRPPNFNTETSATFTVQAENFVAKYITFKNGHNLGGQKQPIAQAVAAVVRGDMASFYNCGFVGVQDTLFDGSGRHYYRDCYIEGTVDFIFGFAKTVFERCHVHSTAGDRGGGYLTAQGRGSDSDTGGYVFKYCIVTGTGPTYLGRAWDSHARVVFYKSQFNGPIAPAGWDAWNHKDTVNTIFFAEQDCLGQGSGKSHRVSWERTLSGADLSLFTGDFNEGSTWIPQQP